MDQSKYIPKGEECLSKGKESRQHLRLWGEAKGENHGFTGRPSRHWMLVNIQVSVSGLVCPFLQIYTFFDCVVINHQKRRDCNEHGPI